MTVLGLDFGKKRVGVALSDPAGKLALGLEVVDGRDRFRLLNRLQGIVSERGVRLIVLGLPLSMSGECGPQAKRVEDFRERLQTRLGPGIGVELWDERLTSRQVDQVRPDGHKRVPEGTRDLMAAVLILQSYLDRNQLGQTEGGLR